MSRGLLNNPGFQDHTPRHAKDSTTDYDSAVANSEGHSPGRLWGNISSHPSKNSWGEGCSMFEILATQKYFKKY